MKPGPAISVLVTSGSLPSSAAIFSARSRGFSPASLASAIAALVARSPWLASRGGSTTMRDEIGRRRKDAGLGQRRDGGADMFGEELKDVHAAR